MRKGDLVEIEFWDHADGDRAFLFKIWGKLHKVTKLAYTVCVWANVNPKDPDELEERRTIVRSAVTKIHKLYKTRPVSVNRFLASMKEGKK